MKVNLVPLAPRGAHPFCPSFVEAALHHLKAAGLGLAPLRNGHAATWALGKRLGHQAAGRVPFSKAWVRQATLPEDPPTSHLWTNNEAV